MIICGDAAHAVVGGRQHRDRLSRNVHAGENPGQLRYARQPFVQHRRVEVIKMQDRYDPFSDPRRALHGFPRSWRERRRRVTRIPRRRRVAFHKAFAFGIHQKATFSARAFRDEAAYPINAGRMKLHELHILQRQASAEDQPAPVAGAGMRRRAREINPP